MSWSEKVRALQSLSAEIPDARIELIGELCEAEVISYIGAEVYAGLSADPRLEYAVSALAISRLILSSRAINEGSSIHRSSGWGEGEIMPSEISEILSLAGVWDIKAREILKQLRSEVFAEFGWVDI